MGVLEPFQAEQEQEAVAWNQRVAAVLDRRGYRKLGERLRSCRDRKHLRVKVCADHHHPNGLRGSDCGIDRLCPYCAQLERRDRVETSVARILLLQQHKMPAGFLKMLTVTMPGEVGPEQMTDPQVLRAFVDGVAEFQTWLREKAGQVGVERHLERSSENQKRWHVHMPCLGTSLNPLEVQAKAYDLGLGRVDITKCYGTLREQIAEVSKYVTKFDKNASPEFLVDTWETMSKAGVRRSQPSGLFLTNKLSEWLGFNCKTHLPGGQDEEHSFECYICGCEDYTLLTVDQAYTEWRHTQVGYFSRTWTPTRGNRPPPRGT